MIIKGKLKHTAGRALSLMLAVAMAVCLAEVGDTTTLAASSETGTNFTEFSTFTMYKYVKKTTLDQLENGTGDVYNGPTVTGLTAGTTAVGTKALAGCTNGKPNNWDASKFGVLILSFDGADYLSKYQSDILYMDATDFGNNAFAAFDPSKEVQYLTSLEDLPTLIPCYDYGKDKSKLVYYIAYRTNGKVNCDKFLTLEPHSSGGGTSYYCCGKTKANTVFLPSFTTSGACRLQAYYDGKKNAADNYSQDLVYRGGTYHQYCYGVSGNTEQQIFFAYEVEKAGSRIGGTTAPASAVTYKISANNLVKTPSVSAVSFIDKNVTLNVYGTLVIDNDCYCTGTLNVYGDVVIKDGGNLHTSYAGQYGTVNVYSKGNTTQSGNGKGNISVCEGGTLSVETTNGSSSSSRLQLYTGSLNVDGTLFFSCTPVESYKTVVYIRSLTTPALIKFTQRGKFGYRKPQAGSTNISFTSRISCPVAVIRQPSYNNIFTVTG